MSKPEFVYVTYIETTPEKLWEALTSSEFSKRYWFGTELRSDWKVGSSLALVMNGETTDTGEILEADRAAAALLHFQARAQRGTCATEPATKVVFTLEPLRQAREADLTHEGFVEGSKLLGRHLQGMAGHPVRPQEPAGNRQGAGRSRRSRSASGIRVAMKIYRRANDHEHREIQARDRLHDLHRLYAGEGVGGADISGVQPKVFFRQCRRGRSEGRRRLHRAHAGWRGAHLAAR